jgi:hypothetical protein
MSPSTAFGALDRVRAVDLASSASAKAGGGLMRLEELKCRPAPLGALDAFFLTKAR